MHFYGWEKGLKTGMYYLRTRAPTLPTQVTIPANGELAVLHPRSANPHECSSEEGACVSCSA